MADQTDTQEQLKTSEVMRKTAIFVEQYGSEIVKEYAKNEVSVQEPWLRAIFGSHDSPGTNAATAGLNVGGSIAAAIVGGVSSIPTAAATCVAGGLMLGTKVAVGIYSKRKAKTINKSLTKLETAVKFGTFGGLALKIIYEQQIAMIDTDPHIKSFANYASEVTLNYFKKCTEEKKTPHVNELIKTFPNIKFPGGKVKLITGKTCKMEKLFTKPEPRERVRERWHYYKDVKAYKPEKYGYRTGLIQWPIDNDSFRLILPKIKPVEENIFGYQPKFLIVGKHEWDDYCDNVRSKSFNERVKEMYLFNEDIRAVFLPKEVSQELHLTMPKREGSEADFSKTILPFFQRDWFNTTDHMLDLTHVNFKGSILDGALLKNTKLQKLSGSSIRFAVLDGTDFSTFTGDIKCLYPQSCTELILTMETLENSRSKFHGFETEDIKVISCAEESRKRVEAELLKLLQLHESLPFEIAEQAERIRTSILEEGEKGREETRKIVTNDGDKTRQYIKDLGENILKREPMAYEGAQETAIDALKVRLSGIIYDQYSKIPNWTLHSDHLTTPMEDIYVDITLTKDKGKKEEKKLKSYRDIFEKVSQRRTIYLSAKPGAGKTTLVQRMCIDWAKKSMTNPTEVGELAGFDNFQLVLPIFLRHVAREQNFIDVIKEEYRLDARDAELLRNFIDRNQSSVCILLDGIDEYNEEISIEMTDIIHRRKLSNTTLFITSRYSSGSIFDKDRHGPEIEIKLEGFSEHGTSEFIQKYFKNEDMDDLEADKLLEEMEKLRLFSHLKNIPAVLLMVISLWKIQRKLPSTLTGLYKEFVSYYLARNEKKKIKDVKDRGKTTDTFINSYHQYLMKFGALGSQNIEKYRLPLEFSETDIYNYISSDEFGFLIEKLTHLKQKYYSYLHKTLQEFMVAYYFFHSEEPKQVEMLKYFCSSHEAFEEFTMMRRFLLGFGGEEMFNKIENVIPSVSKSKMLPILQLDYLTENPEATIVLPDVLCLCVTDEYSSSVLERYFNMDGTAIFELEVAIYAEYLILILDLDAPYVTSLSLEIFNFSEVSLAGLEEVLDDILYKKWALKTLKLKGGTFFSCLEDLLDLCADDGLSRTLKHLHLNSMDLNGSYFIVDEIKEFTRLYSLTLSYCDLDVSMYNLIRALPPTVQYLDVTGNSFSPREKHETLVISSEELEHSLGLSNNKLTKKFGFSISSTFQSLCGDSFDSFELIPTEIRDIFHHLPHKLTHLGLSYNNLQYLFMPTEKDGLFSSQLQSLDLTCCHLTSTHVETFIKTMPWTLRDVILSHNDLQGVSMIKEQTRLPTSKLQLFYISNCRLTAKDIFYLVKNFPTTLRNLDISGNGFSLTLLDDLEHIKTPNFRMEQLDIFKMGP